MPRQIGIQSINIEAPVRVQNLLKQLRFMKGDKVVIISKKEVTDIRWVCNQYLALLSNRVSTVETGGEFAPPELQEVLHENKLQIRGDA